MVSVIIMFIHQRLLSYNSLPPDWLVSLLRTGRERNKAIRRSADNLLDRNSAHLPLFAPRNSRLDATDTDRSETAIDLHRCLELLNEVNHQLAEQKVTQRNELMWRRIFDKVDLTAGAIFLVLNCSVTFYAFFWVAGGLY
uniref:Uncharacterized protein n=1 Tax=Plectus sambesii TaxID=2011161 RepID=A0A914USL8_9BILA